MITKRSEDLQTKPKLHGGQLRTSSWAEQRPRWPCYPRPGISRGTNDRDRHPIRFDDMFIRTRCRSLFKLACDKQQKRQRTGKKRKKEKRKKKRKGVILWPWVMRSGNINDSRITHIMWSTKTRKQEEEEERRKLKTKQQQQKQAKIEKVKSKIKHHHIV